MLGIEHFWKKVGVVEEGGGKTPEDLGREQSFGQIIRDYYKTEEEFSIGRIVGIIQHLLAEEMFIAGNTEGNDNYISSIAGHIEKLNLARDVGGLTEEIKSAAETLGDRAQSALLKKIIGIASIEIEKVEI
jgi:hypothetical protein